MATYSSYPQVDYTNDLKLLAGDPSRSELVRVSGQSLFDYLQENLDQIDEAILGFRTTSVAKNENLAVGRLLYTAGNVTVDDGAGGAYLVVDGGTGDIPMLNGNDLLAVNPSVLDSVLPFDSVPQMQAAGLSVGQRISTAGYYESGDGGGADYEIVAAATGTADGGSFIELDNGLQAKALFSGAVNVRQFGASSGGSEDTASIQAAINYAKTFRGEVHFPAGDYSVTGIIIDGFVKISGVDSSTEGSRIFITSDAPAFDITNPCTIDGISIYGEGSGIKTNQHGIRITSVNDVYIRNVFFDNLYDCVHIFGEVFYTYIIACRWYRSINTMIYGEGNTPAGFAIQIQDCQATPPSGFRGFWFKNFGSVIIDALMMSPTGLTGEGIFFDGGASLSGVSQIDNTVIEGSDGVPLRIRGVAAGTRDKFIFCSNVYFGSGSTQPTVELDNARGIYFANCYYTGGGSAFLLSNSVTGIHITDAEFQSPDIPILASAGAIIEGLYLTSPDYRSASVFIDANSAASISNVSVVGGTIGIAGVPIQPAAMAGLYVRLPGSTKFKNRGIATFNGGVSLFSIPHGLTTTPKAFSVLPNTPDAGGAEIREVTVNGATIDVQCKGAAAAGTNNIRWAWSAEI